MVIGFFSLRRNIYFVGPLQVLWFSRFSGYRRLSQVTLQKRRAKEASPCG
jgi:hypothetical protein